MLLRYFGFREDPFGATPDPRFLYPSPTHQEALASLLYGFYSGRGFTALIAQPGMGKTTLLFHFLDDIRNSARSIFLFDTQCEPRDLIRYILRDLGITPAQDCVEMHEQLNGVFVAEALAGRKVVLVIDEAQNLSDAALETVRLLTNFETPRAKLMQIVLAGQPQISNKLVDPSMLQLRQRISTICRIEPLSKKETFAYIDHRLKLAGYSGVPLLTEDALQLVAEASQGIPRTINNLCFNALSLCCALKRRQVDRSIVAEVIADQQLTRSPREILVSQRDVATEYPLDTRQPEQGAWLSKLRAPTAALLLLASTLGILWVTRTRSHTARYVHPTVADVSPSILAPATVKITNIDAIAEPIPKATPLEITVEPQQTLRDIALQHLGEFDENRLHQIQILNPDLINPNLIRPGQKILLPAPTSPLKMPPQSSVRNIP
jgi:general secretion pathway protein A